MCYEIAYYVDKGNQFMEKIQTKIPRRRKDGSTTWSPFSSVCSSRRSSMSMSGGSRSPASSEKSGYQSSLSKIPDTPDTEHSHFRAPMTPQPVTGPEFFCLFRGCKYCTDRKGDLETHVKFAHNLQWNLRQY